MFCIVKFIQEEKGILAYLKNLFNRQKPEPKQINIMSSAPFFYLEIGRNQCGKDFEKLTEILGSCARFILPCGDTEIPDNNFVKKYRPTVFPSIMLLNSAEKILQSKSYNKSKYSIAFVDRKAQFFRYVESFVELASVIVIFTENNYIYQQLADDIFERYGASLILRRSDSLDFSCNFTVCPEECCIVEKNKNMHIKITGASFHLPSDIEQLRPGQTDKLTFASALYELCAVKKLENTKYNYFCETEIGEKDLNLLTTGHF